MNMEHVLKDYLHPGVALTQELFENGDPVLAPVLTWEWLRCPSEAEMKRQLKAAKRAGFGTVYILPMPREFRPDTMATELDGYLSPAFFEKVRAALQYADETGLRLWLYDEGGWPSGSACGKVAQALPDRRAARLVRDENGDPVLRGMGKPDIYDEAAAACFTRITHHAYAAALGPLAGKIEAMFTDEPAGSADAVNDRLLEAFAEAYGYRMEPYLPALLSPETSDENGAKARRDYYALLGERFRNTLAVYRRAGLSHGWLSVGHLDRDHTADSNLSKGYGNTLAALKQLDIPGVDAIAGQILSTGNRMDGSAVAFYPRFASSAAIQNGTPLALSESFAVYGNALSGDEMRYILNSQLVRGIDLFNFMAMPSTMADWYAYSERPYFHPDIPGFFALDSLCKELERECVFMATGLRAEATALWYSCAEILDGGQRGQRAADAFRQAGEALEAANVDFDLIDADTLLTSPVEGGLLLAGGASYARVVIPDGCEIPEAAREKLAQLRGEARRTVRTAEPAFLHRTVRDNNGSLHICVFNGSNETKTAEIFIDTDLPLYRCDPKTGAFFRFRGGEPVTLAYGQCALLLASGDAFVCGEPEPPAEEIALRPVRGVKTAEFCLSERGASLVPRQEALPFSEDRAVFPAEFCGEAAYSYSFRLDEPRDCLLSLSSLLYFAEAFVNGTRVGSLCAAPYELTVGGRFLRAGENELTLRIANLAAVAYARTDAGQFYGEKYIGPYHARTLAFEQNVSGGGFTGLRLKQM